MARHWITYSVEEDPRRGGRRGRRRRWSWPWQWFRRERRPRRTVAVSERRRSGDGERRRLWPWLLLLLLLLLIPIGAYLLLNDSDDDGEPDRVASAGNPDPSSARVGESNSIPGEGPPTVADVGRDGVVSLSVPGIPSLSGEGDITVMDLGEASCHDERYVLMSDGQVHVLERLDDETVEALASARAPIDTIALDPDADATALQTIAERTGGAFTQMAR